MICFCPGIRKGNRRYTDRTRASHGKGNLEWSTAAVAGICRNERYCGDIIMQKSYTVSFLTHQTRRNVGQRRLYYEPEHHEGIVSREEHARALLLLKANHASPSSITNTKSGS
jgi:hypothetical protein